MIRQNDIIIKFIEANQNNGLLADYFQKCYENLKELNKSSEKYSLALILVIFVYLFFGSTSIESFEIGPLKINDISVIPKILPVIVLYVLFSLYVIERQKTDLQNALKIYSYTVHKQLYSKEYLKEHRITFITRLFLPYSPSNMISSITNEKFSKKHSIIGLIVLFPILFIGFSPYFFLIFMLYDIYLNYYNDLLGIVSFWISIWVFIILIFYLTSQFITDKKADQEFSKNYDKPAADETADTVVDL